MTKGEIATWLGMANIMFMGADAQNHDNDPQTRQMFNSIREALMAAQLILMKEAIEEAEDDVRDSNE